MIQADVVIGAVLVVGAAAPKLVTREMVSKMKKGAVLVDIKTWAKWWWDMVPNVSPILPVPFPPPRR